VDVAIRFGPGGWRGHQSRLLANERLVAVASPDHREGTWPLTQAELGEHVLIHHPESSWRLWLDPAEPDPMHSGHALYLDNQLLVIEAAAAGHGIALVRERLAADELRRGRLVPILGRAVSAEYSYWAVWSASSPKRSLIAAFVEAVQGVFDDEANSTGQ
jgi:LysR family glycine cleavage system transcriptional activator